MKEKYRGYNIEILADDMPESSREWDNLGTMVCFHSRYALGDKHNLSIDDVNDISGSSDCISLPLYLYDHSGITMNTSGFSCRWDSGQVGIIYVSKDEIRKEYGWKRITKSREAQIIKYLKGEVETYDMYLRGDVNGYQVTKGGADIGSCWGYYGTEQCSEDARSVVDAEIKLAMKRHFE